MRSRIQVENILEKHPEARDNDFVLCWLWLQMEYGIKLPKLSDRQLNELNGKFSTLTRWRRKIQSSGKYLPTNNPDNIRDGRRVGGQCYKNKFKQKSILKKTKKLPKIEAEINGMKDKWDDLHKRK